MNLVAGVAIAALCCIALVTCVAVIMGQDSGLVTGATSAMVGISAGVIAYMRGKSKGVKEGQGKPQNPAT